VNTFYNYYFFDDLQVDNTIDNYFSIITYYNYGTIQYYGKLLTPCSQHLVTVSYRKEEKKIIMDFCV